MLSTWVEMSELLSLLLIGLWKRIKGSRLLHCVFLVQLTSGITYVTSTYHFDDELFRSHFQLPFSAWSKTVSQIKVLCLCILLKDP